MWSKILGALACVSISPTAWACGGSWCEGSFSSYEIPAPGEDWLIRPGNTPLQIAAALFEAYSGREGSGPFYAQLTGIRNGYSWDQSCLGNSESAAKAFDDALAADSDAKARAAELGAIRKSMLSSCGDKMPAILAQLEQLPKGPGQEFVAYLQGAAQLYSQKPGAAVDTFQNLQSAQNPWVKETATYVRARALLRQAQEKWDGFDFDSREGKGLDLALVDKAGEAYRAYLKAYPKGAYAASAESMERRILFLKQDHEALNKAVFAAIDKALSTRDYELLAQRLTELYYLTSVAIADFPAQSPLLAAAVALKPGLVKDLDKQILAVLDQNSGVYGAYPGLLALVKGELLVRTDDAKGALAVVDPALVGGKVPPRVQLALRYLRARALEKTGNHKEGMLEIVKVSGSSDSFKNDYDLEAAMLRMARASRDFSAMYQTGSPLRAPDTTRPIYQEFFSDDERRELLKTPGLPAEEREKIVFAMLKDRIKDGKIEDFLKTYEEQGKPKPFTEVETAARTLVARPKDPTGLFNYGYFLLVRLLSPTQNDICCSCYTVNGGDPYGEQPKFKAPLDYYMEALANISEGSPKDLEPKILHYAIMCFKQSREGNLCIQRYEREDVPLSTRKAWFAKLRGKYKGTKWEKETKYVY